jgi:hypothetical protein
MVSNEIATSALLFEWRDDETRTRVELKKQALFFYLHMRSSALLLFRYMIRVRKARRAVRLH